MKRSLLMTDRLQAFRERVEKGTHGLISASSLKMSRRSWEQLRGGGIHIVRRGADVIAAVWCGDDTPDEEARNAAKIAAHLNSGPQLVRLVEAVDRFGHQAAYIARRRGSSEIAFHASEALDALDAYLDAFLGSGDGGEG